MFLTNYFIQTIQFSISVVFVHTQLNVKTVLFQVVQFYVNMQFSFTWPIDRALSGATTPKQSRPGRDGNEGVLHICPSSSITGKSDCLVSYPGWVGLGEVLPPRQRCSWCILQPQPTGQVDKGSLVYHQVLLGNFWVLLFDIRAPHQRKKKEKKKGSLIYH